MNALCCSPAAAGSDPSIALAEPAPTYDVLLARRQDVQAALEQLAKRGARRGLPALTWTWGKAFSKERHTEDGRTIKIERIPLTFTSTTSPKYAGWSFVAALEHLGEENITRTVPRRGRPAGRPVRHRLGRRLRDERSRSTGERQARHGPRDDLGRRWRALGTERARGVRLGEARQGKGKPMTKTCAGEGLNWYGMTAEQQASIPEAIRDYDWAEAFGYAPFSIFDVAEVIASANGEHDQDNWVGVFRLKDGRYGYLTAGCDYTGWDCQAGGHGDTRATLDAVMRELLENDDRRRLKITTVGGLGHEITLIDGQPLATVERRTSFKLGIEDVSTGRLRVLLRDAGMEPGKMTDAQVRREARLKFGDTLFVHGGDDDR